MNPTYKLKDIIHFWQRQMQIDFRVIQAIVNFVEYKRIKDVDKSDVIVKLLRNHGLFEIGYKGNRTFLIENNQLPLAEEKISNNEHDYMRNFEVAVQLFNIRILNANIQFNMVLN